MSSDEATMLAEMAMSNPLNCVRNEVPHSRMVNLITYIQKFERARIQMIGFLKTSLLRKWLYCSPLSCTSAPEAAQPSLWSSSSTSGSPTEDGVSLRVKNTTMAPTKAIAAGIAKQRFQADIPKRERIHPQRAITTPAPMECEAFQIDCLVASSDGLNQCAIRLAQGG